MDVFESCHKVNDLLQSGEESIARDEVIKLLATVEQEVGEYTPVINHLIREVGLYPYIQPESSSWQDRYIYEAFKVDTGNVEPVTLHREQSRLLSALLSGKSIAVSAPTSFGKSFVIDSFIAIRKPATIVILVPTIALADETRRRLQNKFGDEYKIITTSEQSISERNIFIFPQERAISYLGIIQHIDLFIVDEFYKASKAFDSERAPALIRAIMYFQEISDQRYFLAPNISSLRDSQFTRDMEFLHLDFNTVFLEKTELFEQIGKDESKKTDALLSILESNSGKSLIYAGTFTNIQKISNIFLDELEPLGRTLLAQFQSWLSRNYDPNWELTKLAVRGIGIHNGQLHRSLSQIQIKLFEESEGLDVVISTSSIIEGVNTSAKNVIIWSNKNGRPKLNDFTYKNIMGRGGRMFKHFIGKIFVLEQPPADEKIQLDLDLPDELLGTLDEELNLEYTSDQVAKIQEYESQMMSLLGERNLDSFRKATNLQSSSSNLILGIARDIRENPTSWNGLRYLNSDNAEDWDRLLYKLIELFPNVWGINWGKYVSFVKILSNNWKETIPELLDRLDQFDIGLAEFFKLERNTTFVLASLLGDVNVIYNRMNPDSQVDLAPAISKFSHAFLPPIVYQLEEYGIPRMISRKIQNSGVIDLENEDTDIHEILDTFRQLGLNQLLRSIGELDDFDLYILRYFYDGITPKIKGVGVI